MTFRKWIHNDLIKRIFSQHPLVL